MNRTSPSFIQRIIYFLPVAFLAVLSFLSPAVAAATAEGTAACTTEASFEFSGFSDAQAVSIEISYSTGQSKTLTETADDRGELSFSLPRYTYDDFKITAFIQNGDSSIGVTADCPSISPTSYKIPVGEAFACTPAFYQVLGSSLNRLNTETFEYTRLGNAPHRYNAIGYNIQDNYLYGIQKINNTMTLMKIDSNGVLFDLGEVDIRNGSHYRGDFDLDGNLVVTEGKNLYKIDVDAVPPTVETVPLTKIGNPLLNFHDITYNRVTDTFFTFTNGQVIEIDPHNQTIEQIADFQKIASGKPYGAAFSDINGDLYFSKNKTGAIYFADLDSNGNVLDFYPLADGGANGNNDGASCPLAAAPFEMMCTDQIDNDLDGLTDEADPDCFDEDNDSIPSIRDLDDDNDGIPDVTELETALNDGDTDNDGIPDNLDLDADGDGRIDAQEAGHGQAYDADGRLNGPFGHNGLADSVETEHESDIINYSVAYTGNSPSFQVMQDTDGDSVPDIIDIDDDNDGIPDSHECTYSVNNLPIAVVNGSFEEPDIDFNQALFLQSWGNFPNVAVTYLDSNVGGWSTTHLDHRIEIWQSGFNLVGSYNGSQHAEINANGDAALYQDVATAPGQTMVWSFAHRGRSGPDTIDLNIGPADGLLTTVQTITTDQNEWIVYSGEYIVPAGQDITRFEYRAVSTASGNNTVGNFLDNIQFYVRDESLNCDLDTDGDSIIDSLDLDADGDGLTDAYEAGHHQLNFDTHGRLTGTVGANGLIDKVETEPDSAVISYSIRDTDLDNTPNFQQFTDFDNDGVLTVDIDLDNDGILNTIECAQVPCTDDFDQDGIPNALDLDSDNDSINDLHEIRTPSAYNTDEWLRNWLDKDYDGVIVGPFGANGYSAAIETDDSFNASYRADFGAEPQDDDQDQAYNFLDLDNNNDNVFDIETVGFGHLDIDQNGRVDNMQDDDFDGIATITDGKPVVFGDRVPAALTVEMFSNKLAVSGGDSLEFTIIIKNVGYSVAQNLDITASLPDNMSHGIGESGSWTVPTLSAGESHSIVWKVDVNSAEANQNYKASVSVTGTDDDGNTLPSDQSVLVSDDIDPLDTAEAAVLGLGQLTCQNYTKNVAYEDLKNEGWSDWDYNDLIVQLEAKLCFTPTTTSQTIQSKYWAEIANPFQTDNGCNDIHIEAETGSLAGFVVVNDEWASGGSYIVMPEAGIGDYSRVSSKRSVTYTVNIPTAGRYAITGGTQGTGANSDSFWFQLNDEDMLQWQVESNGRFTENHVGEFQNNNKKMAFDLTAGDHTIGIYNREDGTRLDHLSIKCLQAEPTPELALATSTITYTLLARGANFDHALRHNLPFLEGGQFILSSFDGDGSPIEINRGQFSPNQPIDIFASTKAGLPSADPNDTLANSRPEQAEHINGQSAVVEFVLNHPENYLLGEINPFPWDLYISVLDTGQAVHLVAPGHMNESQLVNGNFDATSPLIGYNLPLGFSFDGEWTWPSEFYGIWRAYPNFVDYFDSGFASNQDWFTQSNADGGFLWTNRLNRFPVGPQTSETVVSRYFASPVVADLDGDRKVEIVIGDLIGNKVSVFSLNKQELWSQWTHGPVRATAVVEDIDFDGDLEILVGDEAGYLYAWHHDGEAVTTFPIKITPNRILASPTIADINDNGTLEIIQVGSDNVVYVFDTSANLLWQTELSILGDSFGAQTSNGER